MKIDKKYNGIFFMLLAALGFSVMGGATKSLKDVFSIGQLTFYRNIIGLISLLIGFYFRPVKNPGGGKSQYLFLRGLMGTTALYTLFYCIVHLPLGTAMTYNLTSAIFIAIFSFLFFGEFHGRQVLFAVLLGFGGMVLIYKPNMHFPLSYHLVGLLSGITSAFAYMTVGRITKYYDTRVIVLAFVIGGVVTPLVSALLHYGFHLPADGIFVIDWKWPSGWQWFPVLLMGLAALFGQYFVTKAYGADKVGVVSAISYANIVFSVFIGMMLGDAFPDWMSLTGILFIIGSGVIISMTKRNGDA